MSSNVKEGVQLKSVKTRIEKEKAEIGVLTKQKNEIQEKIKEHDKTLALLQKQLGSLTNNQLCLSEHAVLRFIERVEFVPPGEVEAKVITPELNRMWETLGNGEFPIGIGTHTCVIKNGIITTIK